MITKHNDDENIKNLSQIKALANEREHIFFIFPNETIENEEE